jgi:hypothetical protein
MEQKVIKITHRPLDYLFSYHIFLRIKLHQQKAKVKFILIGLGIRDKKPRLIRELAICCIIFQLLGDTLPGLCYLNSDRIKFDGECYCP